MIELDDTPEERLKQAVTSPYDIEDSDLEALLKAIATQFDDIETARSEVYDSKFIDTASDAQLERLGSIVPALRRRDETEDEFRQRTKAELRSQLSSGTHSEIAELVSVLLDTDRANVNIEEQFRTDDPSFVFELPVDPVGQQNLNTNAVEPLLDDVSAVGVSPTATLATPDATISINALGTRSETIGATTASITISAEDTDIVEVSDVGLSSAKLNDLSNGGWL